MRRAFIALTFLSTTLLSFEGRAQSTLPQAFTDRAVSTRDVDGNFPWIDEPTLSEDVARLTSCAITPLASGMLIPAQVIQPGRNHGSTPAFPFRPVGTPTAWVTAKDVANITLNPGGNGSNVVSCVNKGSAGGAFAHFTAPNPSNQTEWRDDGFLGPGLPYFRFIGLSGIRVLEGQFPSSTYVTASAYTAYVVMYAHALTGTAGEINQTPTVLRFADTGFAVNGGGAILYNKDEPHPTLGDYVQTPIASGDATLHVWKVEHAGGMLSISVDGGAPVTLASGNTTGLGARPLLGFDCCSFNAGSFNGAIAEWIVYNRQLTPSEDRTNMAYLRSEWGTP